MRKSLAHLTLGATPAENIEAAAAAGFWGVGIRICGRFVGDTSFLDIIGDQAETVRLARLSRDAGVVISNISAFQFYPGLTTEHLRRVVDTVKELGSDTLVVNCFMPDREEAIELFSAYDEMARRAGARIALEYLPYSTITDLAAARAFIADSGAKTARLLIDALHLDRAGDSLEDLAALPREELAFWQICDAMKLRGPRPGNEELMQEARTARLRLGQGELPLSGLMAVLPSDLEVEYEVADASIRHLPPAERARAAMSDLEQFLSAAHVAD
ncbi:MULTISPECIES: TIM barrel protein [unclassified Pelagibacterium]|uniref:TIM barrel protein n=1 Tax=Pelagibacterium TaxID=1082930 RepID=UPI0028168A9D|nr:TIM barrel protein [Pelagibacterium sp. H642]WMT91946.1 sugar phosphate isomerase/epimerase [Pelagibacterium sp. H642]